MTSELNETFDAQEYRAKREVVRAISLQIVSKLASDQLNASDLVIDDLIVQFIVAAVTSILTTVYISRQKSNTPAPHNQFIAQFPISSQEIARIARWAGFSLRRAS
jgi:hypothetical protein